jgi:Uncharacterized conserved protein (DUF2190)
LDYKVTNSYIAANTGTSTVLPFDRFARIDGYASSPVGNDRDGFSYGSTVFPIDNAGGVANCVVVSSNYSFFPQGVTVNAIVSGVAKVEAAGIFEGGDPLASDANGKAIKATAGQYVVGYALENMTTYKQGFRNYVHVLMNNMNSQTDGRGHFLANGSGITSAVGNGFGTVTLTGNSSRGNISVATGSGFPSTNIINHTFTYPYAYAPTVIVTPTNALTAAQTPYVSASSATGFTVTLASTGSSQTYSYNYMVIA